MAEQRITRQRGVAIVGIDISATVVTGTVSSQQLLLWVRDALEYYHRFRGGHVGREAAATIRLPLLEIDGE